MRIITLLATLFLAAALSVAADDAAKSETGKSGKATTNQPKEVGNKNCPISGKPVGSMEKGAHVDYKGQRVGLCCNGCKSAFLSKADANLKKAQDDATSGTEGKKSGPKQETSEKKV